MSTRLSGLSTLALAAFAATILPSCGGSRIAGMPPAPAGPSARDRVAPATSSEQVLFSFSGGNDGGNAASGIVVDAQGNLYGTTVIGGTGTCGTVFTLAPRPSPPWPETVLY